MNANISKLFGDAVLRALEFALWGILLLFWLFPFEPDESSDFQLVVQSGML